MSLGCELSRRQPHLFMYSYSSGEAVKDTLHGVCGPIKQGDAGQVSLIAQEIK